MLAKKLTEVDAKIITDLLADGRKTFTEIAKECGEEKSTICKRFKELQTSGVIVGATIQLDYAALRYFAVGSIRFRIHPNNIDNAIERVRRVPDIYHAIKQENNTAVNVVATLRTIEEFNRLKEMILKLPTVSELTTNIWMGIRNMPHNLQISKNYTAANWSSKKLTHEPIEIDEIDNQIIDKLALNGQAPFAAIAKELGVATNTVIRKYQRLKDNGIIRASIQVNPVRLGYRAVATFNLAFVSQSSLSAIVDRFSSIPNVFLMIKTSGQFDLSVFCLVKDIDQFLDLQQNIGQTIEISKSQTLIGPLKRMLPGLKEYISTF